MRLPMTDDEVMNELRSTSLLNLARKVFYSECARIEQADDQSRPPGPIERRRMEFEAVRKIAAVLGTRL
jgi:hypothetical protein